MTVIKVNMFKARIYSLDTLRIIACICLILHHYSIEYCPYYEGRINFSGGRFDFSTMVEFFFILSGFLTKPIDASQTFLRYFGKKWLRLMPMVIITAVAYELIVLWIISLPGETFEKINIFGLIITVLGISGIGFFENPWVNGQLWYISVLLLCYILYFILEKLYKKVHVSRYVLFVVMVILGIVLRYAHLDFPLFTSSCGRGYCGFFTGLLLSYEESRLTTNTKLFRYKMKGHRAIFGMVFILTILVSVVFEIPAEGLMLSLITYPCVILFVLGDAMKKFFDHSIIGTLGKASFDVYVWHIPVILIISGFIQMGVLTIYNQYWFQFVVAIICFIVGVISYFLIDKPLSHRLTRSFT